MRIFTLCSAFGYIAATEDADTRRMSPYHFRIPNEGFPEPEDNPSHGKVSINLLRQRFQDTLRSDNNPQRSLPDYFQTPGMNCGRKNFMGKESPWAMVILGCQSWNNYGETFDVHTPRRNECIYCSATLISKFWAITSYDCMALIQDSVSNEQTRVYYGLDSFTFTKRDLPAGTPFNAQDALAGMFLPRTANTGRVIRVERPVGVADYPIALLRITNYSGLGGVDFASNGRPTGVMPICLPDVDRCVREGAQCQSSNWFLLQGQNNVHDKMDVMGLRNSAQMTIEQSDAPNFVAATGDRADSCLFYEGEGDAGEVLTCTGQEQFDENDSIEYEYLYGISKRCADGKERYVRITEFLTWIQEVTNLRIDNHQKTGHCLDAPMAIMARAGPAGGAAGGVTDEYYYNYIDQYNYDYYGGYETQPITTTEEPAYQGDWGDYEELDEYEDEFVDEVLAERKAAEEAAIRMAMLEAKVAEEEAMQADAACRADPASCITGKSFRLGGDEDDEFEQTMKQVKHTDQAFTCNSIFSDEDIIIDGANGDDDNPWITQENTMSMTNNMKQDQTVVCTSPTYDTRCRLAPASDGVCSYHGIGIERSMLVSEQLEDGSWSKPMHTMHFRCGYDDTSDKENKMRWMRLKPESQRYGPDRESNYGTFKILCGLPNCRHPSTWDHEDFAVHRNDQLDYEHININNGRNGVWKCFDKDGNSLESANNESPEVPPGGSCRLSCNTANWPEWMEPTNDIKCEAGIHDNDRDDWSHRDLGSLFKQLSMPKWKNRSMRRHTDAHIAEVYGDIEGWKCHNFEAAV